MRIDVHHYHHLAPDSSGAPSVLALLQTISQQGVAIMGKIEDLEARVDKLAADATAAEARANAEKSRADAAEQNVATLQGQLTDAQSQIADLKTQLQTAQDAGAQIPDDVFTKLDAIDAGLNATLPDTSSSTGAAPSGETIIP